MAKYENWDSTNLTMSLAPTASSLLFSCKMSTLTTPDEGHASRAGSSEHSLNTTHVDNASTSQCNFRKHLADVEKSALSSSTSLQTDPFYVRYLDPARDVHSLGSSGRVQGW